MKSEETYLEAENSAMVVVQGVEDIMGILTSIR